MMSIIPLDKRDGWIWMDGRMLEWGSAIVHVLTHSLHYGGSAFEGIRIYNGKPFKLQEHNQRLLHSAKALHLDMQYSLDHINAATLEVLDHNNLTRGGYIRPLIWRGSETMVIDGKTCAPHIAIAAWETFEEDRGTKRQRGMRLQISKWKKAGSDFIPYDTKTSGIYMMSMLAKLEANKNGFDDALLLDIGGHIAEASTANFFIIKNNKLYTPVADCFLNGITRQTIIELAGRLGIETHETKLSIEDLRTADSAFLTGTAIEIMPVISITSDKEYMFDIGHPMIERLMQAYKHEIETYTKNPHDQYTV